MNEEKPLTVSDIAKRYSVKPDTVQQWFRKQHLRGVHLDARWSCTWDAVFEFEGRLASLTGAARTRAQQPLLTVTMIADRYGKHPESIRKRLQKGILPGRQIMRRWYADWDGIAAYEAEMRARDWRWSNSPEIGQTQP